MSPTEIPQREDLSPYWQTRVLGAAILIAALALVVWLAYGSVAEPPPEVVGSGVAIATPAARTALPRTFPAVRTANVAASAPPLATDESEVCGIGRLKTADVERDPRFQAAQRRSNENARRALSTGPLELGRAATLAFQSFAQEPIASNCEGADCAVAIPAAGAAEAREALARMAVDTLSPTVYMLALRACDRQRTQGSCGLLSLQQWAKLDPDNAVPWLTIADEAARRGETSTVQEAMFHASVARTADDGEPALLAVVAQSLSDSSPPLERALVMNEALAFFASQLNPATVRPLQAASNQCSAEAVRNANRQQLCGALADVLVTKGRSLLNMAVGTGIGARAGWSNERVETLRRERQAMFQASLNLVSESQALWSCESLERQARYFNEVASYGEVEGMRRTIQRSGSSVDELARQYNASAPSAPR